MGRNPLVHNKITIWWLWVSALVQQDTRLFFDFHVHIFFFHLKQFSLDNEFKICAHSAKHDFFFFFKMFSYLSENHTELVTILTLWNMVFNYYLNSNIT